MAVLNTTSADGQAGKLSRQIEDVAFLPGDVESFVRDTDQTVVMYQRGQKRAAAKRVARELVGIRRRRSRGSTARSRTPRRRRMWW